MIRFNNQLSGRLSGVGVGGSGLEFAIRTLDSLMENVIESKTQLIPLEINSKVTYTDEGGVQR